MLKSAFNAIIKIHSREALLKRLGTVDTYSPIRISPSNYFRFLRGPEHTTIAGREFIIPVDSIKGQFAQLISFSTVPTSGVFKLKFGASTTGELTYDSTTAEIKTALAALPGLSNVAVSGDYTSGIYVILQGFKVAPSLGEVVDSTLDSTVTIANTYWPISTAIVKGDRILDGTKLYTADEIMEMVDLGGNIIGYRVRCD